MRCAWCRRTNAAAGYNHLLAHESGEIISVEVSARKFGILYAFDGVMAHTNHYLVPKMQEIEDEPDELVGTRLRYFRGMRLLKRTTSHSLKTIKSINGIIRISPIQFVTI